MIRWRPRGSQGRGRPHRPPIQHPGVQGISMGSAGLAGTAAGGWRRAAAAQALPRPRPAATTHASPGRWRPGAWSTGQAAAARCAAHRQPESVFQHGMWPTHVGFGTAPHVPPQRLPRMHAAHSPSPLPHIFGLCRSNLAALGRQRRLGQRPGSCSSCWTRWAGTVGCRQLPCLPGSQPCASFAPHSAAPRAKARLVPRAPALPAGQP